jgi:purine nucleosidase
MPTFPRISEDRLREMLEPPAGPVRVLIDTDTHNEIDDQFAITWALLSQDVLQVEGSLAEPYSHRHHREPLIQAYDALQANREVDLPEMPRRYTSIARSMMEADKSPHDVVFVEPDEGMERSYQEILKVYELLGESSEGKVLRGSPGYLTSLEKPIRSPATDFLIERAMARDDRPLYIAAIGCLTNVASAILLEPEIITRIVLTWTASYPSCVNLSNLPSLNLMQDVLASQLIFDCGVPFVYLPGYYVGEQLKISLPEMELWMRGKGKIGDYLYHLYAENPLYPMFGIYDHFGRTWTIWDLINIAWLLKPEWVPSQLVRSPILTDDLYYAHAPNRHWIREAYQINRDAIFRDFFTKLEQAP